MEFAIIILIELLCILGVFSIPVFIYLYLGKKEIAEQTEYFNKHGRPFFDKKRKICKITKEKCPVRNVYFSCVDCECASNIQQKCNVKIKITNKE